MIAKYVSDLFRNEPVNIGVIAWCGGATAFRFLGANRDGNVDGRILRGKIQTLSLDTYKQWISSWVKLLSRDKINFIGKPETVTRVSERFLDALESTSRGNYILERGGDLLEDVAPTEIDSIADYLFHRLVDETLEDEDEGKAAKVVRDELLREAEIAADERVQTDKRVPVTLDNSKTVYPEFHIYIGNGKPDWLAQVLPLTAQPKAIQTTAESIAWKFERVIQHGSLKKDRAVAIVYSPEERQDELINESLIELSTVAQIFNLRMDRARVVKAIREWVQSVNTHA
ncbi:MAG TPA: hypothetical protein VMF08_05990 [Candidatus Sulfotelmatobacter sp.]|nr:hypothetical protein [Candidatus Sulfotelmatobacter sp.]